jgi:hypothetical protein
MIQHVESNHQRQVRISSLDIHGIQKLAIHGKAPSQWVTLDGIETFFRSEELVKAATESFSSLGDRFQGVPPTLFKQI